VLGSAAVIGLSGLGCIPSNATARLQVGRLLSRLDGLEKPSYGELERDALPGASK
jgi:hypothetical protein